MLPYAETLMPRWKKLTGGEGEGVAGAASFCESCPLRLERLRWAKRDASRTVNNLSNRNELLNEFRPIRAPNGAIACIRV
jgi:hypothetical protein